MKAKLRAMRESVDLYRGIWNSSASEGIGWTNLPPDLSATELICRILRLGYIDRPARLRILVLLLRGLHGACDPQQVHI